MIFEVQARIIGDNLIIDRDIEFKHHPYLIRIILKEDKHYLSFQKKLLDINKSIPTVVTNSSSIPIIALPPQ